MFAARGDCFAKSGAMAERVTPKDLLPVLRNDERPAVAWSAQADGLLAKKLVAAALLTEVRAVARGADATRLRTWLAEKTPAADAVRSKQIADGTLEAIERMKRFRDTETEKLVAKLLEGVLDGGDAVTLFTACAEAAHETDDTHTALDLASGAGLLAIAGDTSGPASAESTNAHGAAFAFATKASILMGLGRFDDARESVELVAKYDEKQGRSLRTYLSALTHPFDFRAAGYLEGDADDDATVSPLTLDVAQSGIRSIAARIAMIRSGIVAKVGEPRWLPSVAPLLAFDAKLIPSEYAADSVPETLPDLIFELRAEWNRLSWALAALGATTISMPTSIAKPRCTMAFVDEFTAARYDLLCDIAEEQAPTTDDPLDAQLLESTWGGTKLKDLEPNLAQIWLDETESALAGLRWAMGTVPTPWEVE